MWLQFCRRKKVRSSQHSAVQYWYSKCTPITNAREFAEEDIQDEKNHLQELIRYLDNANSIGDAVNTVEREFDERVQTADDSNAQEPVEKVDDNLEGPTENRGDDDPVERTGNEFQRLEEMEDGFQEDVATTDDEEEELMVDFREPMAREFEDDIMEEPLVVDEPMIMT